MEFRQLGTTGERISSIGLGTWQLAGMMGSVDRGKATALVRKAIDGGCTFIDTAEKYGDSEQQLGKALADGYRKKVFLATKVSTDFTASGVKTALENSLKALRTEWIDLYQIHRYDPNVPVEETLQAMVSLQEQGLIRYCGVSNFTVEQLQRALQVLPIVSNQINYNALNRSPEQRMIEYCRREGIAVITHSSLAKGILAGKYGPDHKFASDDERSTFADYSGDLFAKYLAVADELKGVAESEGIDLAQAAVIWLLAREEVASVLIGPKTVAQFEESIGALEALASNDRTALREKMNAIIDSHDLPPLCPFQNQLV
ncbi:MAG: aldo/keto reductase [Spirochaetaceae bacterium]|nr:MAG: aldo/keto reductase [Spirochaetaceae bacterium]